MLCIAQITMHSQEYLYPVAATFTQKPLIYLLYQKSLSHLELWLWDPATNDASKALLSTFNPAGLTILPGQIGFSFIDNDRVRIHYFNKRSVKTITFYEPLYDITTLVWIDQETFLFSAREHRRFRLYHATVHDYVERVVSYDDLDCMYPQKVNDSLFYVERTLDNVHSIIKARYPTIVVDPTNNFNSNDSLQERAQEIFERENRVLRAAQEPEILLTCTTHAVAFLNMINQEEGFYVAHPLEIARNAEVIAFDYYHLQCIAGNWKRVHLFTFLIPYYFVAQSVQTRLYESILPLLPRYDGNNGVYFMNSTDNQSVQIFYYDLLTGMITQKTGTAIYAVPVSVSLFCPLLVQSKVFYGGCLVPEQCTPDVPGMWINQQGALCFNIPQFSAQFSSGHGDSSI